MFRPGDGVIRVGDATTHGGRVLTGQQNYIIHGKAVVVEGDLVSCPIKGHGVCPVINGHPTIFVNGKRVAFHGSHTGCGAQLITSDPLYALGDESTGLTGSIQRAPSPTRFQQPQQRNSFVDENEAPCDHPDQALDLSEYIVSEIQKNAVSDHVRKMKRWNSITAEDVEELWRKIWREMTIFLFYKESVSECLDRCHDQISIRAYQLRVTLLQLSGQT